MIDHDLNSCLAYYFN